MFNKFPHVVIPVFHPNHLDAVVNEAERLGYIKDINCPAFERGWKDVQCVHLQPHGLMYAYACSDAEYLVNHSHPRYEGSVLLKKLRKLRGLYEELNPALTESQDNLAQLVVVTHKDSGRSIKVHAERSLQLPVGMSASYGCDPDAYMLESASWLCTCDVDASTKKTCRYTKVYGGTCIKDKVVPELAQTLEPMTTKGKVVYTAKPSFFGRVTRSLVLASSKVLKVFASVIKLLRGSK